MRVAQEKVRQFHEKYGYPHPDRPTLLDQEAYEFRLKLIREETDEYEEACQAGDVVEIADALADLIYVVLGTAVYHGIQVQPVFDEVHLSNMSKELARDAINKPIKGAAFRPPRIADVLLMQTFDLDEIR